METLQAIRNLMAYLQETLKSLQNIESAPSPEYCIEEVEGNSLELFLMDAYFHSIAEGIAKRQAWK